jgi:GlcNAc-P-P-Und epimerase
VVDGAVKVLVVGGSGFIGSRVLEVLVEEGHDVVNLDLIPSPAYPDRSRIGDVRSLDALIDAGAGCDIVVLLAAEHRDDVQPPSLYEDVNVGGARAVVEAATRLGVHRIVFTSTVAVYGLDKLEPDEETPLEPFNEYGRTKVAAEQVLRGWADAKRDRSLVVVRPSVVFGEGNRGNVYTLVRLIASRRFVMVGAGRNRKSMSYVGNVAAFLCGQLSGPPGTTVVNYADKPDLTMAELVELVHEVLGTRPLPVRLPVWIGLALGHLADLVARVVRHPLPVSAIRARKFCAETSLDTHRLELLGFRPPESLVDALGRTIAAEFGAITARFPSD